MTAWVQFREVPPELCSEFVARGHRPRNVFPHRLYVLPACGPDALWGCDDPDRLWLVLLHAPEALAHRLPAETFWDPDLIWHQEHFGLPGHVAFAMFALHGPDLRVITLASDLVQRQARRPELRTRIHTLFRGWAGMLLNGVIAFACEQGVRRVLVPPSDRVLLHTDPSRSVDGSLFRRVYDAAPADYCAQREANAWVLDVAAAAPRIVMPFAGRHAARLERSIYLCHDIEHGQGHEDVDAVFAARIEVSAAEALPAMLAVEARMGVRAT